MFSRGVGKVEQTKLEPSWLQLATEIHRTKEDKKKNTLNPSSIPVLAVR